MSLFLVWSCLWGWSQTNEELFRDYQFNFTPPGARANGMGGAFIGVADDATSSFANPAGLAFLNETAVTLEYRVRRRYPRTGEIVGNFNTRFEQSAVDMDGIAFFSFNFRWKSWYFGIFQYEYLDEHQERTFQSRSLSGGVERIENRSLMLDLEGRTRGVGIARRFGATKLGLTVNLLELEGNTSYDRQGFSIGPQPTTFAYESSIRDSDRAWGFSLGLLREWSGKWSTGAVWRGNPRFGLIENARESVDDQPVLIDEFKAPFVVPDVIGVGARYKARPGLSLLFDWQQIFYSQIIEEGFVIVESLSTETKENYRIDDISEVHLGAEWLIPGESGVWALRGGYFLNPLHGVEYRGSDPAIQDRFAGTGLSDENHVTFGVGYVFRNRIEIDFSANFWETGRELNVSFIWRKK